MRGRRTEEIQPEEEMQPVLRQDTQGTLKEGRPSRLEPLSHPGVPPRQENPISSRFVGDLLPNQVNSEKDISKRVKNAMDGIKKDPEIISNLGKLSEYIKNSSADEVTTTNKTPRANDRVKKDLTITIVKEYPEIITDLANSEALSKFIKDLNIKDDHKKTTLVKKIIDKKSGIISDLTDSEALSKFIKGLEIANNKEKTDLVKKIIDKKSGIISDLIDSKSLSKFIKDLEIDSSLHLKHLVKTIIEKNPEIITDLKNSKELSGFIKDLGIEDDLDNSRNRIDLIKTIFQDNPEIISDLKNSEELLGFIKDLNIATDQYRADLTIAIIKKNPEIITDLKIIPDPADSKLLSEFIKDLGIKTNYDKTDLVIAVIRSNPGILGENDKEENLSNIIGNFKLHYFPNLLFKIIKELPQDLNISYGRLSANLYPRNGNSRKELIFEAISLKILNKDNFLNWGFDYLKQDGLHLEIIEEAKTNKIVTNKDLFYYLEDKLPNCYESLNSVLNDKKVKDIIREEAIPNIVNFIYGENPTDKDIKELKEKNATSLISFFDFFKKNEVISASLKEDSKENLKSSFRPINPEKIISRDVKNIAILFGMDPKELRILMKKNENGGPSENDSKSLVRVSSGTSVTRAHSAFQIPSVTDASAPTLPSSIPVVSVSNAEPSNSPSPFRGCFQAILKCLGR